MPKTKTKGLKKAKNQVAVQLYFYSSPETGLLVPLISKQLYELITSESRLIEDQLIHKNDSKFNYFALLLLQQSFLLKVNGKVVERPQHMLMRVALSAWPESLEDAFETYKSLSNHYFVPTPLMMKNAGTNKQQYQTSVALSLNSDCKGVLDCLDQCMVCAKIPADVGIGISEALGDNAEILGTATGSRGILSLLQIFHNQYKNIEYLSPGSVVFYLEIWHKDIYEYLFSDTALPYFHYNVVIPDLFMERLRSGQMWYLMCPSICPGLAKASGSEFVNLYMTYKGTLKYDRAVSSRDLWRSILQKQEATGYPSIIFKDNMTAASNHKRLGPINTSNKYASFALHSKGSRYASAHSAHLVLPSFCNSMNEFDFEELERQVRIVTRFLDQVIDRCHYETSSLKRYNETHRPLAIGAHGLADLFQKMEIVYTSSAANVLNRKIFKTIYFAALETSCELAKTYGPHESLRSTPMGSSYLHIDNWSAEDEDDMRCLNIRESITAYGIRNSTFVSLKPDQITALVMGVSNSVEPYVSNIIQIEVYGQYFKTINERLMRGLIRDGVWNFAMRGKLFEHHDCIKKIDHLLPAFRFVFKTAGEVLADDYIRMARARAPYVDQSQSTKIYLKKVEEHPFFHIRRAMMGAWAHNLKAVYKVVGLSGDYHFMKLFENYKPKYEKLKEKVDISYMYTSRILNREELQWPEINYLYMN